MIDREKVIKGLECCKTYGDCSKCPYDGTEQNCNSMRREALTLIKEQQNEIWEYQELNEYLQDKLKKQEEKLATMRMIYGTDAKVTGELVRCKDCKHFCKEEKAMVANQYCSNLHRAVTNDWFCADGERQEGG